MAWSNVAPHAAEPPHRRRLIVHFPIDVLRGSSGFSCQFTSHRGPGTSDIRFPEGSEPRGGPMPLRVAPSKRTRRSASAAAEAIAPSRPSQLKWCEHEHEKRSPPGRRSSARAGLLYSRARRPPPRAGSWQMPAGRGRWCQIFLRRLTSRGGFQMRRPQPSRFRPELHCGWLQSCALQLPARSE